MISISVDAKQLNAAQLFIGQVKNQLPFATSLALNQTARDVQQALKQETTNSFANPVPYTRNAFRYKKSTKALLIAEVFADPSRRYFPTEVFGGQRRIKQYEGFIRGLSQGSLPPGKLVPTSQIINAAGNPKRNVFSIIQAKLSTTDRGGVFIGTPKGSSRTPGVYRRSRERLFAYFVIAQEPRYKPLFPMKRVGEATASRVFPSHLSAAIDRAVASRR